MDYYIRLSSSEEVFRVLLTDEYRVKGEKMETLIEDCESSLKLQPPSPLYDVVFHKVVRDVLNFYNQKEGQNDVLKSPN